MCGAACSLKPTMCASRRRSCALRFRRCSERTAPRASHSSSASSARARRREPPPPPPASAPQPRSHPAPTRPPRANHSSFAQLELGHLRARAKVIDLRLAALPEPDATPDGASPGCSVSPATSSCGCSPGTGLDSSPSGGGLSASDAAALREAERAEAALGSRAAAARAALDAERADASSLSERHVRKERLSALMARARVVYEDRSLLLHAPQQTVQGAFEAIVCCPAARESRLLKRWLAHAFEAADDGGAPCDCGLSTFVEYFSKTVAAQYDLLVYLPQLQLCTWRLVAPILQARLYAAALAANGARDARFRQQQRWMRTMPAAALSGEVQLSGGAPGADDDAGAEGGASPDGAAGGSDTAPSEAAGEAPLAEQLASHIGVAASALSDFGYTSSPADMLLAVYRAVDLLHSAAADVAHAPASTIGADALLPLLVLLVVRAELPQPFSALEYAKSLATTQLAASELGYYLACLEAALAYVLAFRASPADADDRGSRDARGGAAGEAPGEVAKGHELVHFLRNERVLDDLVETLAL